MRRYIDMLLSLRQIAVKNGRVWEIMEGNSMVCGGGVCPMSSGIFHNFKNFRKKYALLSGVLYSTTKNHK